MTTVRPNRFIAAPPPGLWSARPVPATSRPDVTGRNRLDAGGVRRASDAGRRGGGQGRLRARAPWDDSIDGRAEPPAGAPAPPVPQAHDARTGSPCRTRGPS